ncbi:MAG: S-layer homology domain-containing protein [Clostridiales bacterium]|jgi:hypothetical protein|nr:S-layer homology domain-containing protein [Clostridiales bacterium]
MRKNKFKLSKFLICFLFLITLNFGYKNNFLRFNYLCKKVYAVDISEHGYDISQSDVEIKFMDEDKFFIVNNKSVRKEMFLSQDRIVVKNNSNNKESDHVIIIDGDNKNVSTPLDLVIDNLNIKSNNKDAIYLKNGACVNLKLIGSNSLFGECAIRVPSGNCLIISGDGTLNAGSNNSKSSEICAIIGAGCKETAGQININDHANINIETDDRKLGAGIGNSDLSVVDNSINKDLFLTGGKIYVGGNSKVNIKTTNGVCIGGAFSSSIDKIIIEDDADIKLQSHYSSCIGGGSYNTFNSVSSEIIIKDNANVKTESSSLESCIGSGVKSKGYKINILGNSKILAISNESGSCIGAGNNSSIKEINIKDNAFLVAINKKNGIAICGKNENNEFDTKENCKINIFDNAEVFASSLDANAIGFSNYKKSDNNSINIYGNSKVFAENKVGNLDGNVAIGGSKILIGSEESNPLVIAFGGMGLNKIADNKNENDDLIEIEINSGFVISKTNIQNSNFKSNKIYDSENSYVKICGGSVYMTDGEDFVRKINPNPKNNTINVYPVYVPNLYSGNKKISVSYPIYENIEGSQWRNYSYFANTIDNNILNSFIEKANLELSLSIKNIKDIFPVDKISAVIWLPVDKYKNIKISDENLNFSADVKSEFINYSRDMNSNILIPDNFFSKEVQNNFFSTEIQNSNSKILGLPDILKTRPFISGYEDKTFRPEKKITNAEVVQIISRITYDGRQVDLNNLENFVDINKESWYSFAISYLLQREIIRTRSNYFEPNREITIEKFDNLISNTLANYIDDERQLDLIEIVENITKSFIKENFDLNKNITRSEAVAIISEIFGREINLKENIFTDIDKNHWAYKYILSAI